MSDIIKFYNNEKVDKCKYLLSDIYSFSYQELEDIHDYIQWIFPTKERSNYNFDAPVLSDDDIEYFKNNKLHYKILLSLGMFTRFLHSDMDSWADEPNHNHLRITRVLKCLKAFGLNEDAEQFNKWVVSIIKCYKSEEKLKESITFWKLAVYGFDNNNN